MLFNPPKISPLHEPAHYDFLPFNHKIGDSKAQIRKGRTNNPARLLHRHVEAFRSKIDARKGTKRKSHILSRRRRVLTIIQGSVMLRNMATLVALLYVPRCFKIVTDERFPLVR